MRPKDLALLVVLVLSMAGGILFPRTGLVFHPFLMYCVMGLLFLSFLSIRLQDVWRQIKQGWPKILFLSGIKLVALPVGVYLIFRAIAPQFALAALLLSGISAGVVAPFISNLVQGNTPMVLSVVVLTSLVTPLSLPALVDLLAGRQFQLSVAAMMLMLGKVIFLPMGAGELLRRVWPGGARGLQRSGFPLSLAFFGVINLGVFSKYSSFFQQQPGVLFQTLMVSILLAALFMLVGIAIFKTGELPDQLAGAICLVNVNNILVVVFAARFFGPIESTLAAVYLVPFFGIILPLRALARWRGTYA